MRLGPVVSRLKLSRLKAWTLLAALVSAILVPVAPAQSGRTEPYWRRALGGKILGNPEAQAGSVVVLGEDGILHSFSADGSALWTVPVRGRLTPYLTRSREGTSYLGLRNGTLLAVNRSGRELWRATLGSPLSNAVVIGWDGRIFVYEGEALSCYTAAGFRLWRRALGARLIIPPIADGMGGLLAVEAGNMLVRINPYGRILREALSGEAAALAALPLQGADDILWSDSPGPAVAIFYQEGKGEIRHTGGRTVTLPPLPGHPVAAAARGSRVAVLLRDGTVALASAESGGYLWTGISAMAGDRASLLYNEFGIYALSAYGAAGFTEDGRRLWILDLRGASGIPAFDAEGILYSGGTDWILYAYRLESRILRGPPPLFGPKPEGRYGPLPPSPWFNIPFGLEEAAIDRVLDEIAAAVRARDIGEREQDYLAYLKEIAGRGTPRPAARPGMPPEIPLDRRLRALRILSIIGSQETVPFLANLFSQEAEPVISAAAAEALGRIGVDAEGHAMKAFTDAILPPRAVRDEGILITVVGAVGSLCRFSGPPLSESGVRLLVALASDDRPPRVRRRAREELASLQKIFPLPASKFPHF